MERVFLVKKKLDFADWCIKLLNFTNKFVVVGDMAYFFLTLPVSIQINRRFS